MTSLSITITGTSPEGYTADVLTDTATVNRHALRALMQGMAAGEQGLKPSDMAKAGFDQEFKVGWEVEQGTVPGGRRLLRYRVRRQTSAEQAARLRERGGFVENRDGSMGFVLPQPKQAVPVRQRKTHKAPEPQVKPAEPTSPERMKRPRLR